MHMNGPARLLDIQWHLRSIVFEGTAIDDVEEAGANITLGSNGRVSGRGGCNQYFGDYKLEGEFIRFGPLASTLMYCEETMAVEDAFFKALGVVRRLHSEENALEMWSEEGATTLLFHRVMDQ